MPKSPQPNPKPVVKPTMGVLLAVCAASLASGLALLLFGRETQHQVAAFFFLALLGATVTFGLLGATGMVKTKTWQLSGSTAVFVIVLGILLPFVEPPLKEIKGTLYLDGTVVREATITLLETDISNNEYDIKDDGEFRFTLPAPQDEYKFRIVLPGGRETTTNVSAKSGWLRVELVSSGFPSAVVEKTESLVELCRPEPGACTVFLFDYLHEQIEGGELQTFYNIQTDRLDKGIRNYLIARNLLEDISFRVKRCSAPIQDADAARNAAGQLHVPAVMWGFLRRSNNKLVSTTIMDMREKTMISLMPEAKQYMRITLTDDLLDKRHARELSGEIQLQDRMDYLRVVDSRLQEVEAHNPAAGLTPIGGGAG